MKRRTADIAPEDAALFREAIGEVRPLDAPEPAPAPPRPEPRPRKFDEDETEALKLSRDPELAGLALAAAEPLSYRRPEVPERVLKLLRRGGYSVQDELDLHQLRLADAERWLRRFLGEARRAGHLCVRIIHGKGLRSGEGESVLKGLVDRMLRQRADVLAFASAPEAGGGTGAALVLLARRRPGELGPASEGRETEY